MTFYLSKTRFDACAKSLQPSLITSHTCIVTTGTSGGSESELYSCTLFHMVPGRVPLFGLRCKRSKRIGSKDRPEGVGALAMAGGRVLEKELGFETESITETCLPPSGGSCGEEHAFEKGLEFKHALFFGTHCSVHCWTTRDLACVRVTSSMAFSSAFFMLVRPVRS